MAITPKNTLPDRQALLKWAGKHGRAVREPDSGDRAIIIAGCVLVCEIDDSSLEAARALGEVEIIGTKKALRPIADDDTIVHKASCPNCGERHSRLSGPEGAKPSPGGARGNTTRTPLKPEHRTKRAGNYRSFRYGKNDP